MDQSVPITREAALRIALAARAMPNTTLPKLLEVLQNTLGTYLDEDILRTITVTNLKTGLGSLADGEEDGEDIGIGLEAMKLAVRILWGDTGGEEDLPKAAPYNEGDIPNSLRVAIASDSGAGLNGHFGSCIRYLIYQVSATDFRLIDVRDALEADFAPDKNGFRVQLIKDCHVLYVVSIGGPAAAKVIRADIFPIKRIEGGTAEEVVRQFQQVMQAPPPWLQKVLGVAAENRLKNYRAETVET
ncbi:MAG: dinitrogenase iron-molybdenum cofactor biosynthesis protein [Rhodocyclaceae bacterium]|nr:MAG: dinitrogenase iron-molybdenum cofactor biosynthesis protein [Rhodocyclaceae bacterium]